MYSPLAKDWQGIGKANIFLVFLLSTFFSIATFAESARDDYDLDNDGLIEINDLADLDEIRNNLNGASLYSDSTGCPDDGCNGFELTSDLDFDTNQDGVMDSNDVYWNENEEGIAEGWLPLRIEGVIFEGNDHEIKNLFINRAETRSVGLFGYIDQSQIKNVGMTGPLMSIFGGTSVGALVGYVRSESQIVNSYSSGDGYIGLSTEGAVSNYVGGLLGNAYSDNFILNSYSDVNVKGRFATGGLVGRLQYRNQIKFSYSKGNLISPSSYTGGLVGHAVSDNEIIASYSTGVIEGSSSVGGLVGRASSRNRIFASYSTASIKGRYSVGGLLGSAGSNNQVIASFSTASVQSSGSSVGSLIGLVNTDNQIIASFSSGFVKGVLNDGGLIGTHYVLDAGNGGVNSYWTIDSSGQPVSANASELTGYVGLTLAVLQCAIQADSDAVNSDCVSNDGSGENLDSPLTLFKDWGEYELDGIAVWDFGNEQQLPALNLKGVIHRDSDGDGVLDELDDYPNQYYASVDSDHDGFPDFWSLGCNEDCQLESGLMLDQFPLNEFGWKDTDLDGLVDEWPPACDELCQVTSGLTLDQYLDDSDNDGIINSIDTDDNGDDAVDIDVDSDGLIDITNLEQLYAIRFQLDGIGFRQTDESDLDQSGCPFVIFEGVYQQRCSGYELTADLDFDTNQDGVIDVSDDYWNANPEGIGEGWLPLGNDDTPFSSIFEGNGYVIRNLYINRRHSSYVGLFGYIEQSQISEVGIVGPLSSITGYSSTGSLVGESAKNSLITEVHSNASLHGTRFTGGIVGSLNSRSQILNSYFSGVVEGISGGSGGIIGGGSASKIIGCNNTGIIEGVDGVGGVVGEFSSGGTIDGSFNSGNVHGISHSDNVGGLVGDMGYFSVIKNSFNTGYVRGIESVGGLFGSAGSLNQITNSFNAGSVDGWKYVGGIGGIIDDSNKVTHSFNTGRMQGLADDSRFIGGLIGRSKTRNEIKVSFSTGLTMGATLVGGLIGSSDSNILVENSYWATDSSGQSTSFQSSAESRYIGLPLSTLQCAIQANTNSDNSNCVSTNGAGEGLISALTLYKDWELQEVWDFGTNQQLPGLILNNIVHRDSDGDGTLDTDDAFPLDSDNDGFDNIEDAFLFNIAANVDVDVDGMPDSWNEGCDEECQDNSGLQLDSFLNDTDNDGLDNATDTDDDNDGVPDVEDPFPLDLNDSIDTDGDGVGDYADNDDDGDGVHDNDDAFPLDETETMDTDGDGVGNNSDDDDDGDGVNDDEDAFPLDDSETLDFDGDGIGDNADEDDDGDGVNDEEDAFPLDDSETTDTDGDGVGNNTDDDDDGDGVHDDADAFPLDNSETIDSDEDGIGDNLDIDVDGDGLIEIDSLEQMFAIRYQLDGEGYRESLWASLNKTGCPISDETSLSYCRGYELINDLDFDTNQDGLIDEHDLYWHYGEGWTPIGSSSDPFTGILDGNGHEVKNLYINRSSDNYVGLFSYIDQAQIRSLGLNGSLMSVTGGSYFVGALVGYVKTQSVISNSYSAGSVSGGERVGGLLGYVKSDNQITNSHSSTTVTGSSNFVGGLIGFVDNNNQINNSYSGGSVTGSTDYVGGLIGYLDASNQVHGSYNLGLVQGRSYVGGLLGALASNNEVTASFNVGSILANGNYAGGLISLASTENAITSSFNTGAVQGLSYTGGLIGYVSSDNIIQLSFSTGVVGGNENAGGLIGFSFEGNTIENSFWSVDSSRQTNSADSSVSDNYLGITLELLQCATRLDSNNSDCASSGSSEESPAFLDFGNSLQLPGLNLNGVIYRDSDGDGSLDASDQYPLDSDNDAVENQEDVFPFDPAASVDADQDGHPDAWSENCDSQCQEYSSLILDLYLDDSDNDGVSNDLDAFPHDSSETSDHDQDGIGDNADDDDDNDGVLDEVDSDNNTDNGPPELTRIPDGISASVNSDDGTRATLNWDHVFFSQLEGFDDVDGYGLAFEASLNGSVIEIDDNSQVSLPSGYLEIEWIAIDAAGNRSSAEIQIIKIYPQLRFAQSTSVSGDESIAEVVIELSGESPDYPVTVNWQVNRELSDEALDQNDFGKGIEVDEIQQIEILSGDDPENLNTQAILSLPIANNDSSEYDEIAVLDLLGVVVEENVNNLYSLDEQNSRHTLTISYQNLAPSVQLLMEHNAREISQVEQNAGLITVTAIVSDGNDLDEHTLEWDLHELPVETPEGNVLSFDSSEIPAGSYRISVTVTDSGENSLSDQVGLDIRVIEPVVEGESSGAGALWWLSLVLFAFAVRRQVLARL